MSSGCLNLNLDNAKFYFDQAQPGDIVEVLYTGGPPITLGQGGDWSIPYSDWVKGSALSPRNAPPSPGPEALTAPAP
jgi:hypothetical protein